MADRRGLSRQNTLRKVSSKLELLIDDIILIYQDGNKNIKTTTTIENLESYRYKNGDTEIKRITLILSIYHDWNNYIPDEIHTKLSTFYNNTSLKNEFLSSIIKSYKKYTKYHETIFSFQELKTKTEKILSIIHNKKHQFNKTCGIYDFIMNHIDEYDHVDLLNDYHYILKEYYQNNDNKKFENMYHYICERIGPCDISTCSYIKQLYNIQHKNNKNNNNNCDSSQTFSPKEIALIDLLNQIHCLIFHSFHIHRLTKNEKKSLNIENIENNLQITCQSMTKLKEITMQKHKKLKQIFKSEYLKSYPKYIANHEYHGIQNNLNTINDNSSDDSMDDLKLSDCEQSHEETNESTLDSLPSTELHGGWSSIKSGQKMFKFVKKTKHSLQSRSLTLLDGVSRTLTPKAAEFQFNKSKNKKNKKNNKTINNNNNGQNLELQYLFGRKFCYWSYGKDSNDPFYVKPKVKSLKEEIVKKKEGCQISMNEWNIYNEKAKLFLRCNNCKQLKGNKGFENKYKIHYGDEIKIEHILSLLLYCNKHKLRYNFIKTFHPLNNNEIENCYDNKNNKNFTKQWVKRHRKYATFGRLLRESVECFGHGFGMDNEYEKVYYGIDTEIIFTQLKLRLIGPTSTTTNLYFMFSNMMNTLKNQLNNNGLVLRIANNKYPYYFNCNWLSSFSSENEYLFFGGNESVNIYSIINCNYHENIFYDYFHFINSFKLLLELITGEYGEEEYDLKTQKALQTLIEFGLGTKSNNNYDITRRSDPGKYQITKMSSNSYSMYDDDNEDEDDEYYDIDEDKDDLLENDTNLEIPEYIKSTFEFNFAEHISEISIDLGSIESYYGDIIRRYFVSHSHGGDEVKYNNIILLFPNTKQIKIKGRNTMKWNKDILYEQMIEFLSIDSCLNNTLIEIIFEFPSDHYLIYQTQQKNKTIILKQELNKNKFKNELKKCGWNVNCDKDGVIKFYKEIKYKRRLLKKRNGNKSHKDNNNQTSKPKTNNNGHHRSRSTPLRYGQCQGLKKLAQINEQRRKEDVWHFINYDNKNQNDQLPIFKPLWEK